MGAAAYDVAYLISSALPSEAGPEVESALLRAYHEALTRKGVRDYDFDRFRRDLD